MIKTLLFALGLIWSCTTLAQESRVNFAFYDGIFVLGYVDRGGFFNCTGPNINATYKNSKFIVGMLPSLRFKEDKSTPKNSFVTPNLGVGFTFGFNAWVIQVPLYYNPKTATENGRWHLGIGFGLRLNEFKSK